MMVGLRAIDPAAAPAGVVVHPLGEITLRQRVAPLDFVMQRFGVGAVSGNNKFTIQSPAVGGTVDTSAPAVKDLFAPGEFLNLSDHDKLSRPAFDSLTSGVTFSPTVPRSGEKLDTALKYKTIVKKKSDVPPVVAGHYQPAVAKFLAAVLQGAAAQSPLRQSGVRRFAGAANQLGIGETLFTVVSTADLRTAAGIAAGVAAGTSYTQAAQALRGLGARAGTVQVVALHEVAP
jgi:hypothetical protein